MNELILAISDPGALDPDRVGPKAANMAALTHAGFPTPGGFCVTADAYRLQVREAGLEQAALRYSATPSRSEFRDSGECS